MTTPTSQTVRLTPNLLGASFGLTGLAGAWSAAAPVLSLPSVVTTAWWVLAAVSHLVLAVAYLTDALRHRRLRTDLDDATLGPFTALVPVPLLLLGAELARHAPSAGQVVVGAAIVATFALSAWLTGGWILRPADLERWHPGYFLPSVAGGLLSATAAAAVGWSDLALVLFGYGVVSWLVLGSILLVRLFTRPELPGPLLPTLAIEVAPAAVATNAWFALNGARIDTVALLLSGYAVFMALVQLRLLPMFRRAPFGPGFWSFSFAWAAVGTAGLTWLRLTTPPGLTAWTVLALLVLTVGMGLLAARTVTALRAGRYLARA